MEKFTTITCRFLTCNGLLLMVLMLVIFHPTIKCDVHRHGPEIYNADYIFNRMLFSHNSTDAKDYSLYCKYRTNSMDKMITQVKLKSTAPSNGSSWVSPETRPGEKRCVEAIADIRNASNFEVTLEVKGIQVNSLRRTNLYGRRHRSFAIMCEADHSDRHRKQYRMLEYGKRVDGDSLLRYEREHVQRIGSELPSYIFYFDGARINITYVQLKIGSPTAVVFSNLVSLRSRKFYGKVYGTDYDTFIAEMHIYGVKM